MLTQDNCPVGTILIDGEGRERQVLTTYPLAFLQSYFLQSYFNFPVASNWLTWEEAEELGWKIKEPIEMTIEEVSKALGYEVKIK